MKVEKFKTLGIAIDRQVPSDAAEFDKLAGKVGACVDEAIANVTYRGDLAAIRELAIHGREAVPAKDGQPAIPEFKGLEELLKKPRLTKMVKKGKKGEEKDVEVWDETEEEFIERLFGPTETWKDNPPKQLTDTINAASVACPFDPRQRERKPAGPKKLADKWKTTAADFISGKKSLPKLQAALAKMLNGKQFTPPVATPKDDPKNIEALGWLCKEYAEAQDAFASL